MDGLQSLSWLRLQPDKQYFNASLSKETNLEFSSMRSPIFFMNNKDDNSIPTPTAINKSKNTVIKRTKTMITASVRGIFEICFKDL